VTKKKLGNKRNKSCRIQIIGKRSKEQWRSIDNAARLEQGLEPHTQTKVYDYSYLRAVKFCGYEASQFKRVHQSFKRHHTVEEYFAVLVEGNQHLDDKSTNKTTIVRSFYEDVVQRNGQHTKPIKS